MAHIRRAFEAAHVRPDLVILIGVEPESPEVEYGWIEPAQAIQGHRQLHRVRRFWEKPCSGFGCRSAATRLSVEQFCHGRVGASVARTYGKRHTGAV
jgi:mannose-1-phosphate guanylyltransferase